MVIFSPSPYTESVGDERRRYKFIRSVPIYWGRIRSLFIVSILFLFLSAIQLFPFLELFHHSIRGNGISYQEATIWSFAPKDVLLFFLPDAYGYFLDMKKYWVVPMLVQNSLYRRTSFYPQRHLLPDAFTPPFISPGQ